MAKEKKIRFFHECLAIFDFLGKWLLSCFFTISADGVAMGSPLGPLLANVFMSHIKENLEREGKLSSFYRRYVEDTLTIMPNIETASNFLDTLNQAHFSVKFTMETACKWNAPISGYPVAESIATNRDKGVRKTH